MATPISYRDDLHLRGLPTDNVMTGWRQHKHKYTSLELRGSAKSISNDDEKESDIAYTVCN